MTIGYVLDDTLDRPDGVQKAVIDIAEHMRSLGHEVHYIVSHADTTNLKNVHAVGKLLSFKFNGNSTRTPYWSSRAKIKKLLDEVGFDVLHVQMPYSPILAGRVIRMAPKSTRIVGTFHILPYNLMAVLGTRLLKVLLGSRRRIDVSFAVSPPALDFMKKDFGLDGAVLANPVDYDFFNKHNKQTDTVAGRIVFVGRFEERKGVEQLVSAYEVLSKTTACELILCGKGPMLERLKEVNKAKNLGITMTGFVSEEDKAKYLASAELAVFPSTGGESFGIVLAEAMAAGSGVTLGGNNPGYASVLGVWPETLFDPNDIEGFAEKLKEFIENRDLRIKIGNSQRNAVSEYDVKKICSRLMNEAYKLTLDKKS